MSKHSDNPYWPGECRNGLYVESFENRSIIIIFFTTNPLVSRTSVSFYDLKKITSCLLRSIFLGHVMNQFHANLLYTHCIEMVNRRSFCKDTNMCWGPSVHDNKVVQTRHVSESSSTFVYTPSWQLTAICERML